MIADMSNDIMSHINSANLFINQQNTFFEARFKTKRKIAYCTMSSAVAAKLYCLC